MARQLKPATRADVDHVRLAIHHLQVARDLLRQAGATAALSRVRAALKSAEGAQRHVERRANETARGLKHPSKESVHD
jgi:hypothetical protein